MSVIKVNNITNRDGTSGPVIAGIATVSTTSHLVVPTGNTGQKVPLAPDPFIDNLVLALPFNSESVFTDVSPKNRGDCGIAGISTTASLPFGVTGFTSTSVGIQTSISKYYGSSLYISNAEVQQLRFFGASDFVMQRDFTIEMWYNPFTSSSGDGSLFVSSSDGSSYFAFNLSKSANVFNVYLQSGSAVWSPSASSVTVGSWNHLVLQRKNGDTVEIFVNGVGIGSTTYSGTLGYNTPTILRFGGGATGAVNGYVQDYRIYRDVAKYTSNFTPPTQIAL
jgi:hypothetical protein